MASFLRSAKKKVTFDCQEMKKQAEWTAWETPGPPCSDSFLGRNKGQYAGRVSKHKAIKKGGETWRESLFVSWIFSLKLVAPRAQ